MITKFKAYITGGMAVVLVVVGIAMGGTFRKPDVVMDTIYSRMEDAKQIKHLELVTFYFESMVDVTHSEKTDKVYLLMVIPARVSCYIDLEKMSMEANDSLVRIYLPEPVIESPVLDLDSARIFNMNQRYVTASKKSYETVLRNVQQSLIRARQDVFKRAEANGIREEATRLGEGYFRSLFAGLDFEVEFVLVGP